MNIRGWNGKKNFGNSLSPAIVEYLSGKKPTWNNELESPSILATGAAFHLLRSGDHVWGAGSRLPISTPFTDGLDVHCVRGPHTKLCLEHNGNVCPEIYGDPGIFVRNMFPGKVVVDEAIGVIPHFSDKALQSVEWGIQINTSDPIEKVVADIKRCEIIIASALHGIIAAEAFGKPVIAFRPVTFEEEACKFQDWYESTGREYDPYISNKPSFRASLNNIRTLNESQLNSMEKRLRDSFDIMSRKLSENS